jgi:hypothetical protein
MTFITPRITALLALLALPATSQELIHSSLDPAGGRSTGGTITNDATLGGIGGELFDDTQVISRPGFAGQLYDAVYIDVEPGPPVVAELDTLLLSAFVMGDDDTTLDASDVTWSNLGSPFFIVNAAGLITAAAVPATFTLPLQVAAAGLSGNVLLTIYDTIPDNYGPFAGDELDDAWQQFWFGENPALAAPGLDPDGDGQNNHTEFLAITSPLDPASLLTTRIELVPGRPTHRLLILHPWRAERTYTWEWTPDLAQPWAVLPGATITPQPGEEAHATDENAVDTRRLYRVKIE